MCFYQAHGGFSSPSPQAAALPDNAHSLLLTKPSSIYPPALCPDGLVCPAAESSFPQHEFRLVLPVPDLPGLHHPFSALLGRSCSQSLCMAQHSTNISLLTLLCSSRLREGRLNTERLCSAPAFCEAQPPNPAGLVLGLGGSTRALMRAPLPSLLPQTKASWQDSSLVLHSICHLSPLSPCPVLATWRANSNTGRSGGSFSALQQFTASECPLNLPVCAFPKEIKARSIEKNSVLAR